jgi:hypothetical protein
MSKTFKLPIDEPLLNIVSYGRRGPRAERRLTSAEVEHIRRTVQRAPEVMVKVLSRASNDLKAAGKHIDYISRKGEVALETDDDAHPNYVSGRTLLEDWDLDVDVVRRQSSLSAANGRKPPKLIHKLMFSMPPGTPAEKVLTAVRNLAREEFWGQHRYAIALHTDEPHPHVHVVVKAVSEQGERLHIRKATLRQWRYEFARQLRDLGVPANATERAVRGQVKGHKLDGIYRPMTDGRRFSTHMEQRAKAVAEELRNGGLRNEPGNSKILDTRNAIERGWQSVSDLLASAGESALAVDVRRFAKAMPLPLTEKEQIAVELIRRAREPQIKERTTTR